MAGRFSIEAIFKAHDRASRIIAKIETRFQKFARNLAGSLRAIDRMNASVHSGIMKISAATAVAAVGAGAAMRNIIGAGADFEQAISAVGAVSLMTRDQIADLEKKAIDLGATTVFSATEVANGMELMGRAGFTNAEILQGIPGILNAAAAEGAELAETAGNISNVLKGMGLATTEAVRVADVLTLASARTNSSISSLGESMANVSSTARQFNIPLEDTVAAVALLQDVGLDASEAGSAVNTMLTQMAAPSDTVKNKMKKLGVSFKDANGNMIPLSGVMEQLAMSAKKSGGNMEQVAFFAELVGLRGQKAAANLKDMFISGKAQQLTKELQGAAGSAEKMAKLRLDNLKGDLEEFGGAVDSLKISLFQTQSGPLRGVVQEMTKWIDANKEIIKTKVQQFIKDIVDNLPKIITWAKRIGIAVAVFYAWAAAVKVAAAATVAFELAVKATALAGRALSLAYGLAATATSGFSLATTAGTAAQWVKNAALAVGRIATTRITVSTIASTAAGWLNVAATWAKNAAQTAYNVVLGAGRLLVDLYTGALTRQRLALMAAAAWTWLKNAALVVYNATLAIGRVAQALYAVATGTATAATMASVPAFVAANAALLPLIVTLGAAAAAIGALIAAWSQWKALNAETEGLGITGTIGEMVKRGTLNPFEAVDAFQNEQARKRALETANPSTAQVVTPTERMTRSLEEKVSTTKAEVTIQDKTGKAAVTKKPKGKGVSLQLQPSGAF